MVLQLRIAGPGLDLMRRLEAGEPELVLGRDADCDIRLPDPQRNVSRRHLAIWLEDGALKFRVLSVVNGVEMPFGEAPPGARGVLPLGQTLRVGDYSLCAVALAELDTPAIPHAPGAPLQAHGLGDATAPESAHASRAAEESEDTTPTHASPEEDPFGEWGFEATFASGAAEMPPIEAGAAPTPGAMPSFFQGLGLEPASIGTLSDRELEGIGRIVRTLMLGVLELDASATGARQEMHAEDRTLVAATGQNPLKTDWPQQTKLRYMFGGRAAGAGFVNPERALRELLAELVAHHGASGAAARAALEATVKEFAPASLKSRLLGGGARLFEGTRAWNAYCKDYEKQGQDMHQWSQRLLDRYYADAYLREILRIRRETPAPPR